MTPATPANLAAALGDLQRWAARHKYEPPQGCDFRHGASEPSTNINVNLTVVGEALTNLHQLKEQGVKIMALIDDLSEDVAENKSAVDSAVQLLTNLSAQLAAAGTDPAKLQALRDAIDANTASLATAVAANTPAAPPTP